MTGHWFMFWIVLVVIHLLAACCVFVAALASTPFSKR